ncbi:MAG: TonB family protein [Blastocatellia bacterium]|nr:TonB family protein [Blastocatellia bacterium]MCS7158295.1 TonB family protein [Blastocatellia bacterium]MCX7753133.1 TonB family protein [Blastocatellia bacterium]MDW8169448.1 TonB family protein [Acidobacteriota bacterium]MDW8255722.1 TonB family protein [Acidobacteriota bacterium]
MERFSFQTALALEGRPRLTKEARLGALVSLAFHLGLLVTVVLFSTTPVSLPSEEIEGGLAGIGYPRPEIIELDKPFYAPPPEVIRQLAGIEALRPPRRPEFLSERTTVARGEPNPNPTGSSSLPKVSGRGRALPELIEDRQRTIRATPGTSSKEALADPRLAPTLPAPGARGEALDRRNTSIPESVLAAIRGSSAPPASETFSNPQSGVTLEGPPSVDAQAVAAMEEYRAYLERAIQQRWFIPPEANLLSAPATVIVVFEVGRDGRLLQLRLRQSSGISALDRAAINAVRLAAPFRPLPSVYTFESQWFTDKFIYYPPR